MQKFIPVKITDRKWANRLLNGEVFMRSLHEFGSWNENREPSLNNLFRGDYREGTVAVYGKPKKTPFYNQLPSIYKEQVKRGYLIDDSEIKYFKIFSLYRMVYNPFTNGFIKPDPRLKEFGDTAVIIRDYNEFIDRYGKALFSKYEKVVSLISTVDFYDKNDIKQVDPLFSKDVSYSYQNELRMAFAELENDGFWIGPGADTNLSVVQDCKPLTLNIGIIRDIAIAMPINNFLNLKFQNTIRLRFPMSDYSDMPTNYDSIVETTKETMKQRNPILMKPTFDF